MKDKNYLKRKRAIEEIVGKIPEGKFEPGIYNYCDRWCEKCDKTEKCLLYYDKTKEEIKLIANGLNPNDPEVAMQSVKKSLDQTFQLIHKIAEIDGIDLTSTPEDEKKYEEFDKKTDPENHPLYELANQFMILAHEWLSSVPPLDFDHYKEAYDELSWHHTMLSAKTNRALRSKLEAKYGGKLSREFHLEDSKMSGWVAYRCAKKCQEALEHMDQFVRDPRIAKMIELSETIIQKIDQELL